MQAINQLPSIDLGAAFSSQEAFDSIVMELHKQGPFAQSARGLEVLGYKACIALLRDRRLNSDHMALVDAMEFPEGDAKEFKKNMLLSHGRDDYRTHMRRAVTRAIGASVVETQRPMIRELARDILKELDSGNSVDFLNDFAFLLPSSLFCSWFGAPLSDARWVAGLSDRILKIFSNDPSFTPEIVAAYDELFPYVQKLVDAAKESPQENLIGNLVAENEAGQLSDQDLFYLVSMFNEASTDNTAHGIATAVGGIMGDEARRQQIVANPDLIPAAINENMRLSGRINTLVRYASETVEYEGIVITEGQPVFFLIPAAHRDPAVYHQPLHYDPTREDAHHLLDFGGGVYTCLGKHVALIEIQEALAELVDAYPNAAVREFSTNTNIFANAVSELSIQLCE